MDKFKPETPNIKAENKLENQAFIENDTPEGFFEDNEILELKENIDPDFGMQEGKTSDHKNQLAKSIEKYLGRKRDEEKKSALRKFLGI